MHGILTYICTFVNCVYLPNIIYLSTVYTLGELRMYTKSHRSVRDFH